MKERRVHEVSELKHEAPDLISCYDNAQAQDTLMTKTPHIIERCFHSFSHKKKAV